MSKIKHVKINNMQEIFKLEDGSYLYLITELAEKENGSFGAVVFKFDTLHQLRRFIYLKPEEVEELE